MTVHGNVDRIPELVSELKSLLDRLPDRMDELRALVGAGNDDVARLVEVLKIPPQCCEIVGFMLKRTFARRDAIYTVLFGGRPECDQPDIKIIDVQMVRIRKALLAQEIALGTTWGEGTWSIPAEGKAKLRLKMAEVGRDMVPA